MRVVEGIDRLVAADGRPVRGGRRIRWPPSGHAYLSSTFRAEASRRGARPAVITFDHHPDEILTGAAPPLLLDPEERLDRLEQAGVDVTIVEVFDVALRMTPVRPLRPPHRRSGGPGRLPDDARFRLRSRSGRNARDRRGAGAGARV
jgi:hypothetical protein